MLSRDFFFSFFFPTKLNLAQVFFSYFLSQVLDSFDDLSLAQPSYVPWLRLLAVVSFFNVHCVFQIYSFGFFFFFLPSAILFLWNLFLHITIFTLFKGFCCSLFGSLERKSVLTPFHLQLDSFSAVVKSAEKE